jgi:hypothetical protein
MTHLTVKVLFVEAAAIVTVAFIARVMYDAGRSPKRRPLSLTLADLGRVCEGILHAAPDMAWNFYTVSAWP